MLYDKKRKLLGKGLSEDSLLIIRGKSEVLRNGDVYYPFRQDSDFLLLTGLNIPDLRLLGRKSKNHIEWILYSDPLSEKEKLWGTHRLTHDELRKISGIREVRSLKEWTKDIHSFLNNTKKIYIRSCDTSHIVRGFSRYQEKCMSLEDELLPLRMVKGEEEIHKIQYAIRVTQRALEFVKNNLDSYTYEREIEADIARIYRIHGCTEAYPTIVASGPNACILHYTRYDRKIEEGDLILIDTGAEYEGYAADITRTFIKGKWSERKRNIYEAVQKVQKEAIASTHPGRTWDEHEEVMRSIMNTALITLGLGERNTSKDEMSLLSHKYFPHRISHFLGLDVHDKGERNHTLLPGMIITCEPGIYIKEEGIGVRIEDDILITEDGCMVLSREIPK